MDGDNHEPPLPASDTKHLSLLHHSVPGSAVVLPLKQLSSKSAEGGSTGTTGTTLWLSAQLLALYFSSLPASSRGRTVVDLGSGIGFLPLCLAARGWHVIATDVQQVVDSVLAPNIADGLATIRASPYGEGKGGGGVDVTSLDWEQVAETGTLPQVLDGRRVDVITTSDTVYAPHLLEPLLRTLKTLSRAHQQPTIYIGLERRDSALVDQALSTAGQMGLSLRRVDKDKVDRLMRDAKWAQAEWDDVEIWKGKFTKASLAKEP